MTKLYIGSVFLYISAFPEVGLCGRNYCNTQHGC